MTSAFWFVLVFLNIKVTTFKNGKHHKNLISIQSAEQFVLYLKHILQKQNLLKCWMGFDLVLEKRKSMGKKKRQLTPHYLQSDGFLQKSSAQRAQV